MCVLIDLGENGIFKGKSEEKEEGERNGSHGPENSDWSSCSFKCIYKFSGKLRK